MMEKRKLSMEKAIMEKNGLELSGARQVAPVYFNLFFSIILSVTVHLKFTKIFGSGPGQYPSVNIEIAGVPCCASSSATNAMNVQLVGGFNPSEKY